MQHRTGGSGQPQPVGIVAVSAEGAGLCYRSLCAESAAILGPHAHPEVILHGFPLQDYLRRMEASRWDLVGDLLLDSAALLRQAGARFLICPDNTAHQAIDLIRDAIPLPWLHIAEVVGEAAADLGSKTVGILGTRWLVEGPVYPRALGALGIECLVPPAAARQRVHEIILKELVYGRVEEAARSCLLQLAEFAARGCDAVVLGCTEIPLALEGSSPARPTLDSTRLLAQAALREAVSLAGQGAV